MATNHEFRRQVDADEMIKPWLRLGPFYEDLSKTVEGLTLFERIGATVGRTVMQEVVVQAGPILKGEPHEGERASFRGYAGRWSLVRRPERYLSWGRYNISNHLGVIFLTTIVRPEEAGLHTWRLSTRISTRAVVAVNGEVVYDSASDLLERTHRFYEVSFDADLSEGDNRVTVALFRLARMAQVGCRLELDRPVEAYVPAAPNVTEARRAQIETELSGLRLERDVFYPHHTVGLSMKTAPQGTVQMQLLSDGGEVVAETSPEDAGMITLCSGADLDDGTYALHARWEDGEGETLTSTEFEIKKVTPVAAPEGYDRIEERKTRVLAHYATIHERRPIWPQVARYALRRAGREDIPAVDEGAIRETCEFIAARKDCADFVIQGILRLMMWEREEQRLSAEINAMMKDAILGFKYWVDEPGDTVMYMGSENHRFLFHVAEWMAGQLFPTEEFTNSRQRGLYHATKGRMYITEWLRQRGRFGFDEWHSNSYFPIDIAPLLNVYDFVIYEDYKLRQMAGTVLDYIFFDLAADTYRGVFGTTHGRSYGWYLKYPDFEGTASTCWLLYGTGALTVGTSGMAPVCLATSEYELPEILYDIANDDRAVVESRQRQGLLRGSKPHAEFCVYRTPDYMLSGLQDHRKGEFESSSHVAQVTLGQKEGEQPALVFWSCPLTSGEGSGLRPDYWSGHISLPRVVQASPVLSLTWRLPEYAWMTHCFFEPARFDEVEIGDRWAFGRVGGGYVGIYAHGGITVSAQGQYAGRELICEVRETTWLVECGRAADWGSFAAFVEALRQAEITATDDGLIYESPSIGTFVTGWDVEPRVEGEPVKVSGYPLVDSPWAQSAFGSGEMTLRYEGAVRNLWFNQ